MANLIIKEAKQNEGRIKIGCDGKGNAKEYRLPDDVYKVLKNYPTYFRAGAIGPDFFPDMILGQTDIHPTFSGDWVKHMHDMLMRLTPNTGDYYEALAFYLGYTMHYACDMFGHHNINEYAKGWFADFSKFIDKFLSFEKKQINKIPEEMCMIFRHILVESYLDHKVSDDENFIIDIPYEFLRICFTTRESIQFINDTRIKCGTSKTPEDYDSILNFDILYTLVSQYEKSITDLQSKKSSVEIVEAREEYILNWLSTWHEFTQRMLEQSTSEAISRCAISFAKAFIEYTTLGNFTEKERKKYAQFIDLVNSIDEALDEIEIPIIGDIIDLIVETIKNKLKDKATPFIKQFTDYLYRSINQENTATDFDGCVKNIKEIFKNLPAWLNNKNGLFSDANIEADSQYRDNPEFRKFVASRRRSSNKKYGVFSYWLDYIWGNFGQEEATCLNQDYKEFQQCINMGKFCLLGVDSLNDIIKEQDYKETFRFESEVVKHSIRNLRFIFQVSSESKAGSSDTLFIKVHCKNSKDNCEFPLIGSKHRVFKKGKEECIEVQLRNTIPVAEIVKFDFWMNGKNNLIYTFLEITDADTGIIIAASNCRKVITQKPTTVLKNGDFFVDKDTYNSFAEEVAHIPPFTQKGFKRIHALCCSSQLKMPISALLVQIQSSNLTQNCCIALQNQSTLGFQEISLGKTMSGFKDVEKITVTSQSDVYIDRLFFYDATQHICIGRLTKTHLTAGIPYEIETSLYDENYHDKAYPDAEWQIMNITAFVHTEDELWAGTDNSVRINFIGEKKYTESFEFNASKSQLERNDLDRFTGSLSKPYDPNSIIAIEIEKYKRKGDGNACPDWTYDFVFAIDSQSGQTIFHADGPKELTKSNSKSRISDGLWTKYNKSIDNS